MTQTWNLPNGTWTQDESGYWETPETTKPIGAILVLIVTLLLGSWFMVWSKGQGVNTGKTGSQLPSCIQQFNNNHYQEPPDFGVFCY